MALDPSSRYPGQIDESDPAGYPYGAPQNIAVEGDGIGTPLEKDLVSDLFGMQQALLVAAAVTPSGVPDKVGASQYLEAVGWVASQVNLVFTPLHPTFGAAGDGVADDTTALAACFAAATAAAVPGRPSIVDLGGKSYLLTAATLCYPDVSVRNGKLVIDHASATALSFASGSNTGVRCTWENVEIDYAQANSGIVIDNPLVLVRVGFRNCRFNQSGLCTGRLFYSPANSDFSFGDCLGKIPVNNAGFRSDAGTLDIEGGRYSTPLGYADVAVQGTGGVHNLAAVEFDLSGSTGGAATAVQAAGQIANVERCIFRGGDFGNVAIKWNAGAKLHAHNNSFDQIGEYDSGGLLADGYTVDLHPAERMSTGVGAEVDLPEGFESFYVEAAKVTAPNVTPSAAFFLGQRMSLILRNVSGATWVGNPTTVGVLDSTAGLSGLVDDGYITYSWVALDVNGDNTAVWVQSAAPGVI